MLESVLLVVGTSTAKAVARMWIKSDLGTDISDGLIDRLGARVPGLTQRRRTARQFDDMADRIAQQLIPLVEHEYGGLPTNELEAAILGVAQVVDSIQEINPQLLFSLDLEPTALELLLRDQPAMRVRSDLIDSAQLVFDRVLTENCNFIVELTMSLPQFNSLALAEVLKRETEISERVQQALDRIPQAATARADDDQDFDVRYRRHISRELDRLELFGITLSENSSRYELSIAYITLGAATGDPEATDAAQTASAKQVHDVASATADKKEKETQRQTEAEGESESERESKESEGKDSYLRVDDALARGTRHLIRGEAGSGKTTLLQWLAVSAARGAFEGDLGDWNDLVPFFVQLRRYANKELPNPEDFLDYSARLVAGAKPDGWVDRQLIAGKALVLVDGVDELPTHQRAAAREWMLALLREYPDCKFVVTTRPPAVPEDWLDQADFKVAELLPMSLPDIVAFVQHWYDAARRATAHVPGENEALDRYQVELIRVIRDTPSIRSLATAPLLCAMLCALNRDRRTQLPKDRMELYRIALESLLDRRDVEREISQNDPVTLGLREKETLLQDLSYWLILNEQTDVSKEAAIDRIRERLEFMTSIDAQAERVFNHLLTRSGLIREPVEGRIDFIHRTFQEYLGAARAVREANIPLLISKAHDDQWREVIILSAGHAPAEMADELIRGLLARGTREAPLRHRLHLLAVACLETAVELSPDVISSVRKALAFALPPKNMTEARAVASAGSVAAPMLTQYSRRHATTAAACVRALALIGGDSALTALRAFRNDRRVTVIRELIRGWEYFDREVYAGEILADSGLDYGRLTVRDEEGLRGIHHLKRLRRLTLAIPPLPLAGGLDGLPNLELVTDFQATDGYGMESADGLTRCTRLQTVHIQYARRLSSIPALADSVTDVSLLQCPVLKDISPLRTLPNLATVDISDVPAPMPGLAGSTVQRLTISGEVNLGPNGAWIATLPKLKTLTIHAKESATQGFSLGTNYDCSFLENAPNLARLSLREPSYLKSLDGLPTSLDDVGILAGHSLEDASRLGELVGLTYIMLDGCVRLQDFAFLSSLENLTSADFEECERFSDLSLIASGPALRRLIIPHTSVRDLDPIEQFPYLREIDLSGCDISSLDPLHFLRARAHVTIDVSQQQLIPEDLRKTHRFRVIRVNRLSPSIGEG